MPLPEPYTPHNCDLRDFHFLPIEPGRLFGSEFHALSNDGAWRAGVTLWLKSWHQVPAASLPDDDIALARLAELGRDTKTWLSIKEAAMRGWIKCSDGRLYHSVVAEKALEAWVEKLLQRVSSAAGNAKRWGHDADIDGIDADLSKATRLLSAISPRSRALAKLARRQSRTIVAGTPVGNPTGTPEAIPTQSQETGKRKGQRQGQGSSKNDCLIGARERADDQLKIEGTEDQALFDVVAATGFILTDDNREGAASIVRGWLDNGLDLNTAILPAIRAAMPKLKGPTSSLTRFSKIVQHAHAQAKAKAPAPATSGAAVKFEFEDEPCAMADIRRDIAAGLGENRYVLFQDSFRLEPVPERAALQITKTGAVQVFDDNRVGPIRKAAAKHGFSDVWAN